MPYSEASYAEVLRWMENTEIQYVPGGKKAGTKSSERYNRYAKAKTVAEALQLGSLPLDLVNDFERKILKRTGGPIRDRPLDVMQVEDTTSLTETDIILARWNCQLIKKEQKKTEGEGDGEAEADMKDEDYEERKKQAREALRKARLSARFGVKADQISEGTGWAESPSMVASRSRANVEAQKILQAAKDEGRHVTEEEVLRVLRLWAIKRNGDRKIILPEGQKWVHSENVGLLYCGGARLIMTLHCRQYPFVMMLFVQWMKEQMPDFQFSSIFINSAYSAKRHRDSMVAGPTVIKAFGEFEGGNLRYWQDDDRTANILAFREEDAVVLDVHSAPQLMDGNRAHEVEPFTGEERYSLVFFTPSLYARTAPEVREQLVALGFPFPDEAGLDRSRALMPAPKGYTGLVERPKAERVKPVVPAVPSAKGSSGGEGPRQVVASAARAFGSAAEAEAPRVPRKGLLARMRELQRISQGEGTAKSSKLTGKFFKMAKVAQASSKAAGEHEEEEEAPAGGEAEEAAPEAEAAEERGAAAAPPVAAVSSGMAALGGLLARVQAKKMLATGGLLARVQAKRALEETNGTARAPENRALATPARKRPKPGKLATTGTKAPKAQAAPAAEKEKEAPAPTPAATASTAPAPSSAKQGSAKAAGAGNTLDSMLKKAQPSEPVKPSALQPAAAWAAPALKPAPAPQSFVEFANVLSACVDEPAEGTNQLAENLMGLSSNEDALRAALTILCPAGAMPGKAIAAAISEAFGIVCPAGLPGEVLAARAIEGRQRRGSGVGSGSPAGLGEVAHVLATCCTKGDEVPQAAVSQMAQLLAGSQTDGMEVFFMVRAMQGKLGPAREVGHAAIARALVQRARA